MPFSSCFCLSHPVVAFHTLLLSSHVDVVFFLYYSDIDECDEDIDGCQFTCTNKEGGFDCSCPEGKVLRVDQKTCEDEGKSILIVENFMPAT